MHPRKLCVTYFDESDVEVNNGVNIHANALKFEQNKN